MFISSYILMSNFYFSKQVLELNVHFKMKTSLARISFSDEVICDMMEFGGEECSGKNAI